MGAEARAGPDDTGAYSCIIPSSTSCCTPIAALASQSSPPRIFIMASVSFVVISSQSSSLSPCSARRFCHSSRASSRNVSSRSRRLFALYAACSAEEERNWAGVALWSVSMSDSVFFRDESSWACSAVCQDSKIAHKARARFAGECGS